MTPMVAVEDTLDAGGAVVISRDEARFMGWGQEPLPTVLRPLLSIPMLYLDVNSNLKLEIFGLSLKIIGTKYSQSEHYLSPEDGEAAKGFP